MGAALAGAMMMVAVMMGAALGHADFLPDKSGASDTDDGWQVSLDKTDEELERWPNMAATAFSREAFLSIKVMARIGSQGTAPLLAGTVSAGIQIDASSDTTVGTALNLGLNLGVNGGVTISYPPAGTLGANAGANAGAVANAGVVLNVSAPLRHHQPHPRRQTARQLLRVHPPAGTDVKTDGRGGYVSIRTFAAVQVAAPNANDSYNIYGDPTWP